MDNALLVLGATLAITLLYYLTILRRRSGTGRPLPGPKPLPVIGNLLCLRGVLHHRLAQLARIHGPVMFLKLGLTTAVVISSRDAAREAFGSSRNDRRLAAHAVPDAVRALGFADRSLIWMPSAAPLYRTLRGVAAAHVFSPRRLAATRGVRERKARDLVTYFRRRAGREVDVFRAVQAGLMNLVSSVLFSVDMVDVGTHSAHEFQQVMEEIVDLFSKPNVSDFFPLLRPLDLQGSRRRAAGLLEKVFRILGDITDRRLAEASTSPSSSIDKHKHGDFLDALLEPMSAGEISRDNVITLLFDLFVGGSDTIQTTLVWAMAELLRNPTVMSRLRAEIEDALGGKETIQEADAMSLPYLQAVVKEAMRLHPVGPIMLPHKDVEDGVEVGGYAVPEGSTVIFNLWAIMRDPAVWERPDDFAPERFLDRAAVEVDFKGKDFRFNPFGSGRRLCPGVPMAERVLPFILASLLREFKWRLPDGMSPEQLDMRGRFTTANVMAVPLRAVAEIR